MWILGRSTRENCLYEKIHSILKINKFAVLRMVPVRTKAQPAEMADIQKQKQSHQAKADNHENQ